MKLKTIFHRAAAGALCLILCVSALAQTALASSQMQYMEDGYLTNRKCSLTLRYLYPGMTVRLYKVASVNERVKFTAEKDFEDVLAAMTNSKYKNLNEPKNQSDWKGFAKQLNSDINGKGIKATRTETTKLVSGEVVASFTGLEPGLYLAVNDRYDETETDKDGIEHEYVISSAPMLICLPNWMKNEKTGEYGWEPDVKVADVKLDRYLNERFPLTVVKVWLDGNGNTLTNHEASVTIELLQDGKLYTCQDGTSGRQTLGKQPSGKTSWNFTWYGLEPGHTYSVNEVLADGTKNKYDVEVVQVSGGGLNDKGLPVQAVNLKLTNKLKDEDPGPTPTPTPTPTPGVNPTPTPGVNPTPTPGVNPTPTPGVNPTPTPGVNPTPTPGVNPTPTPGVNPTPTPGVNPTPTPGVRPTPTPPPVEIEEPEVPRGELPGSDPDIPPDEIELDDPDVPLGNLPQTGQLWWPVPLMGVLGLFLLLIGIVQRRRDEYDED